MLVVFWASCGSATWNTWYKIVSTRCTGWTGDMTHVTRDQGGRGEGWVPESQPSISITGTNIRKLHRYGRWGGREFSMWWPCSDTTTTGGQLLLVWFVTEKARTCIWDDGVCSCTGNPLPTTSANALLAVLNILTDGCRKMWSLTQVVGHEPLTQRCLKMDGGKNGKLTGWMWGGWRAQAVMCQLRPAAELSEVASCRSVTQFNNNPTKVQMKRQSHMTDELTCVAGQWAGAGMDDVMELWQMYTLPFLPNAGWFCDHE